MIKTVQQKLKQNPKYVEYLHTHSYWYKNLNRNPLSFKQFEEEVKINYKLRPTDKIEKTLGMLDVIQSILSSMSQR